MTDQQIVITGANGQLGRALQQQFPGAIATDRAELDITDRQSVQDFDWSRARLIINAAAYTNVDGAETPEGAALAEKINVDGVRHLADAARQHDLPLIHISTDYVFDGTKPDHLETESFSPLNVYGRTKAAADELVEALDKHYILRTSWVIGDGKNFVRTMLSLGAKGVSPQVVDDQFGRLTFTDELVRAIVHLIDIKSTFGVYNVTNSGDVKSWADITEQIFAIAGYRQPVGRISTEEYFAGKDFVAARPTHSDLNLDKIHATGFRSTDWREQLKNYILKEKI